MTYHAPSTRQLDNGEDRLEGKQDYWLGSRQGKLELAGWHHLVQEPFLEENGEDGLEGKWYDRDIMCTWFKSLAVDCGESCNIWFVLHDIVLTRNGIIIILKHLSLILSHSLNNSNNNNI